MDVEGEATKVMLSRDYDAAAAAYEAHWAPVLAKLVEKFVAQLGLSAAHEVLDLGTGTGSSLRHLMQGGSFLVGIDRSLAMLGRVPDEAALAVMDAERLAFKEQSFGATTAMFVLFHLPHPEVAVREVRRILKDGGCFAFTTWGAGDVGFRGFDIFDAVLDRHGATEGRTLYERHDLTDTPERCRALLEEGGFEVVSVRAERMEHRWTVEQLIGFRTGVGSGRVRWDSLDKGARLGVLEEGRKTLAELPSDEMVFRHEVVYSIGRATR
jgi:SAM-dependent methyltransferase